jgi:hypothetical protein
MLCVFHFRLIRITGHFILNAKTFLALFLALTACVVTQFITAPALAQTLPARYSPVITDSEWAKDLKAADQGGAGFSLLAFGPTDVKSKFSAA